MRLGRGFPEMGPGEPGSEDVNNEIKGLTGQPVIANWATGSMEDHVSKNNMKRNTGHMTLVPDLNCAYMDMYTPLAHISTYK